MAQLELSAQVREVSGKKVNRLRAAGLVPGLLHGPAVEAPQLVQVALKDLTKVYLEAGTFRPIRLKVGDSAPRPVMIHEPQHDHLHRDLIHVEFFAS